MSDDLLTLLDAATVGLTDDDLLALLDELGDDEILAILEAIPPSAGEVTAARAEVDDGLAWIRANLPELAKLPYGPHHRALVGAIPKDGPAGVRVVVGAPRGSGKSTITLLGGILLSLIRLSHPFTVVIRWDLDDAVTIVEAVRKLLGDRPDLVERFPWIRPLPGVKGELRTEGGTVLLARSTGSSIRGLNRLVAGGRVIRPSLVIGDDLETDESARSRLLVKRAEEWILGTVGQLGGPPGDVDSQPLDLVVIGTTLETDALISRMLSGTGPFRSWRRHRFPAEARVAANTDGDLVAVDTAGLEVSIDLPEDAEIGHRIPLWPDGMPLAFLDRLTNPDDELFVGDVVYSREYLLRPRARSDVLFARELAQVWRPSEHDGQGLRAAWLAGDLPNLERPSVGVDPAVSKSEAADYTALVVAGLWRPRGHRDDGKPHRTRLAVPYAERRRVTLSELLTWAEEVADLFGATIAFEAEGAFAWGAQELRRKRVPVRPVSVGGQDKRTRAIPASVWWEARRIDLDESLEVGPFLEEVGGFNGVNDVHDDLVDGFLHAGAYSTNAWRTT